MFTKNLLEGWRRACGHSLFSLRPEWNFSSTPESSPLTITQVFAYEPCHNSSLILASGCFTDYFHGQTGLYLNRLFTTTQPQFFLFAFAAETRNYSRQCVNRSGDCKVPPSSLAVTQSAFKCSLRRRQPLNWDTIIAVPSFTMVYKCLTVDNCATNCLSWCAQLVLCT